MSKRNKPGRIIKLGPYDANETFGIWRSMDSAPMDEDVLCWDDDYKCISIGQKVLSYRWEDSTSGYPLNPTKWMPLPKPPAK